MTKIDEVLDKHCDCRFFQDDRECFQEAMKEYAEIYASRCLEIAADNAECDDVSYKNGDSYPMFEVNKNSIINIDLPEHE